MSLRMMAAGFVLALLAAGAETPLPSLKIEPKTGGSIFFVKNVYSEPLTGYLIELVGYPGSSYSLWQDHVGADVIAPGQERRIEVGNMTVGAVPDYVKIQAAVYADGKTAGVPEKVKLLLDRRRALRDTTRDLIQRLESAKANNLPRETLIANLKLMTEMLEPKIKTAGRSPVGVNMAASSKLISDTAAQLNTHTVDETLRDLQHWEHALAESKPAL